VSAFFMGARCGEFTGMNKYQVFQMTSFFVNVLVVASLLLTLFGAGWEYSTRCYLKGSRMR
jgi:hypothetical protein